MAPKAISDAIRIFYRSVNENVTSSMQIVAFLSEKLKLGVIFFFVMVTREVRIKLDAASFEDYKRQKRSHKKHTRLIFVVFTFILVLSTANQVLYSFHLFQHSDERIVTLLYIDLGLRLSFFFLNLYMVF